MILSTPMKLGYFDEAFTEGDDDWFLFGGLLIDEESWQPIERIEEALDKEVREEFDGLTQIRKPKPDQDEALRKRGAETIYDTIDDIGYTPIVVLVDQTEALNWDKIENPEDIYMLSFSNLVERLQMALQNDAPQSDDYGVMFIDERDDKSFSDLRDHHYAIKQSGTNYVEPTNIVGVSAPLRDDQSNAMALADWIVSAAGTHLLKGNSEYYRHIYDNFETHPKKNSVSGVGVKIIPGESISDLERHPDDV